MIIIISTIVVYLVVLILPVLIYLSVKLYTHSINSFRETTRIESLTKSPLLSFLSETCSGASTIRAFKRENEFINENNKLLNNNILACMWNAGVS